MSEYEGCYVMVDGDPTFWLVEDGERRAIGSVEEMYASGLRPVVVVDPGVLETIPIKGFHHRDTERTEKSFKSSEKEEEKEE